MAHKEVPCQTAPCKSCPFRKDCLKGWLGGSRMREILNASTFVCHKDNGLQCAGHMIIKGQDNEFVRMADRFKIKLGLVGTDGVFDTEDDCIMHHSDV